jgi:acetylornithine/succinyldiaminopimelate/putrescine aminotransferase/predicted amino acid dehydrogenase
MLNGKDGARGTALNPTLRRLLDHCGFDRRFVRGSGAWLFDGAGRRFLDAHSQYGALALGHNHPAVLAAATDALACSTPAMVQPYRAPSADALADALAALTGLPYCWLGCTGAEVVEAAIKAVRRKTGRPGIVTAQGSYHGKTLGALAATAQPQHQHGFGPLPAGFVHLPFGDAAALADLLAQRGSEIAAVLLEPIQGEHGVILPPPGYLPAVRRLCDQHGVALVLDEIQTGLGRTGRLFAYEHEAVRPDVLLLAKALGGGLFPLAACLFAEAFWDPDFALHQSSTFANNNIACTVGLRVLRELVPAMGPGLVTAAAERGAQLQRHLATLPARFPRSVAAVRGRGLFSAIDLQPAGPDDGFLFGYLSHGGLLSYAFAALLAQESGVLVLPSLGGRHTLRIAPPLLVDRQQIDLLCQGLDAALQVFESRASAQLVRGLLADRPFDQGNVNIAEHAVLPLLHLPLPPPEPPLPAVETRRRRYAFLIHYSQPADIVTTDPQLADLDAQERAAYLRFLSALPAGCVLRAPMVRSRRGLEAEGFLIALPLLPNQMLRAGRRRVSAQIQRAVDLAARLGAQVVGLGGFTTPYSRRGLDVIGRGPTITTGNSLTAVMAVAALCRTAARLGRSIAQERVAVVGARGSVAALCARLLCRERPAQLVLFGNPGSPIDPLHTLAASLRELTFSSRMSDGLPNAAQPTEIRVAHDLHELPDCTLILTASGAGRPIIDSRHVAPATILCDVARPPDVSADVRGRRDVIVLDGGLVSLPDPSLRYGIGNLQGLPSGVQLACLCETVILALSDERRDYGVGDEIPLPDADRVAHLATEHGFALADLSLNGSASAPRRSATIPAIPTEQAA